MKRVFKAISTDILISELTSRGYTVEKNDKSKETIPRERPGISGSKWCDCRHPLCPICNHKS